MTDTSQPDVRAWQVGAGYQCQYRMPGGSWQTVKQNNDKTRHPAVFETKDAAEVAGWRLSAKVWNPEIRSERQFGRDRVTSKRAAEAALFKADPQGDERLIRRTGGKPGVVVERRRAGR